MRIPSLVGLALAATVLATPAVAADGTGPYAGVLRQGESRTHVYDNNPSGNPCVDIVATYTVSLRHVPVTDTLTLSVGAGQVQTVNGGASVTFTQGVCARFTMTVGGAAVADRAAYVLTVSSGLLGGGWS